MSFSNYSYKHTGLTSLINGIDNAESNDNNVKNAFNAGPIRNSIVPFTSIDESPNTLNFKYNNTDISDYTIANYIVPTWTNNWQSISIPSWCNKIRYALCGGGGGGGSATQNYNDEGYYNSHGHYYTYWGQLYYYDYQGAFYYQVGAGKPGAGGGAGGFVYSTASVNTGTNLMVRIGTGGGSESAGTNTQIYINGSVYSANGGRGAYKTNPGAGGSGTANYGTSGTNISSIYSGSGGYQPRTKSGSHGRGGSGPGGQYTATNSNTNSGNVGSSGYAIVYFIKNG